MFKFHRALGLGMAAHAVRVEKVAFGGIGDYIKIVFVLSVAAVRYETSAVATPLRAMGGSWPKPRVLAGDCVELLV
jgi:hypothetical protein